MKKGRETEVRSEGIRKRTTFIETGSDKRLKKGQAKCSLLLFFSFSFYFC